ncbi:hypothetical protein F4861DRAFT_543077 [Xylaria intraflava]|nr:hypothetical protein F4861DRAFT_543077 [Xylaria intraflava]
MCMRLQSCGTNGAHSIDSFPPLDGAGSPAQDPSQLAHHQTPNVPSGYTFNVCGGYPLNATGGHPLNATSGCFPNLWNECPPGLTGRYPSNAHTATACPFHSPPAPADTANPSSPSDSSAPANTSGLRRDIANVRGQHATSSSSTPAASTQGVNPSDPDRIFVCELCSQRFRYNKDLQRHNRSLHRGPDTPLYHCQCGRENPRKDNYREHLRACTKKCRGAPYKCVCGDEQMAKGEHLSHLAGCVIKDNPSA